MKKIEIERVSNGEIKMDSIEFVRTASVKDLYDAIKERLPLLYRRVDNPDLYSHLSVFGSKGHICTSSFPYKEKERLDDLSLLVQGCLEFVAVYEDREKYERI